MHGVVNLLPILFLVTFYAWAMISVHGIIHGLHLAALAVSFFVIGTPLPSYLFVVGLLPGHISRQGRHLGIFVMWLAFLILNIVTFQYFPKLYSGSVITSILHRTLATPFTRNALVCLSGVSLVYHWFISKLESRLLRAWFHAVGIIVSALMFYLLIPSIREILVVHMNSGRENF